MLALKYLLTFSEKVCLAKKALDLSKLSITEMHIKQK